VAKDCIGDLANGSNAARRLQRSRLTPRVGGAREDRGEEIARLMRPFFDRQLPLR
jgi:hypothetical protein